MRLKIMLDKYNKILSERKKYMGIADFALKE